MSPRIVFACLLVWGLLGTGGYWLVKSAESAPAPLAIEAHRQAPDEPPAQVAPEVELASPETRTPANIATEVAEPEWPTAPEIRGPRVDVVVRSADSDNVVPGAAVYLMVEPDDDGVRPKTVHARTDGSGRARFSFDELTRGSRRPRENYELFLRVHASGFVPYEASAGTDFKEDNAFRIEATLDSGGRVVLGQVVDSHSRPVPDAEVSIVFWGPRGLNVQNDQYTTSSDGRFHFTGDSFGRVDLLLSHAQHGVRHLETKLDFEHPEIDLGEIVLLPEGPLLQGKTVAQDGTPLPGAYVDAAALEEDAYEEAHEIRSGAGGRFQFATLGPWRYEIRSDLTDQVRLASHRDGLNIVLRSEYPTATVRVLHIDGTRVPGVVALVSALKGGDGARVRTGGGARKSWAHEEDQYVVFEGPGLYSVGYVEYDGDVRYSASQVVVMGTGHRTVELRLAPEHLHTIPVEVVGPHGGQVREFTLRLRSLEDGTFLDSIGFGETKIRTREGPARVRVRPAAPSFVLPFYTHVEIDPAHAPIVLRGERLGGHFVLEALHNGAPAKVNSAQVIGPDGNWMSSVKVENGNVASVHPLPPGSYKVRIQTLNHGHFTPKIEIEAGETTRDQVFLRR